MKREELKALFEQAAASRNGQTISRNQFVKLVLQHGDILGHDWRPRDVKYIFDQRKHQFSFGKNSHYHKNGLALEGFIAGVVNHLHARHELNMKLQRAYLSGIWQNKLHKVSRKHQHARGMHCWWPINFTVDSGETTCG